MKPSLLKGTRDFGPEEFLKREYLFNTIREEFERYGFAPIETPAMERLETLTGKYGDEGDQLLFKLLNNGDFLAKVENDILVNKESARALNQLSKRGLRYDLTVPFARFVAMNSGTLVLPFKRYQIQPVWRADKPQKGRYQEFYQCDADAVGSDSLLFEVDFIKLFDAVFTRLGLKVRILVNHRGLLTALHQSLEKDIDLSVLTTVLDRLDKVGLERVIQDLMNIGLEGKDIDSVRSFLSASGLDDAKEFCHGSQEGLKAVEEMTFVMDMVKRRPHSQTLEFTPSLARGLSYYTGHIFEVKVEDYEIGSIAAGGRYDDLTSVFGLSGVSGVGISFGADRIYDALAGLDLFPDHVASRPRILLAGMEEEGLFLVYDYVQELRDAGVKCEYYPTVSKLKKVMRYADRRGIEYVGLVGEEELMEKKITVKNMISGEQQKMTFEQIFEL